MRERMRVGGVITHQQAHTDNVMCFIKYHNCLLNIDTMHLTCLGEGSE